MIARRALLAAGAALAVSVTLPATSLAQDAAVEATVEAFHDALAAGDARTALSLLTEDALIYESGGVERSRAEYEGHHLFHDIAFAKATKRETRARSAIAQGDMAVVTSEHRITGTVKDKPVDLISLETLLLERRSGAWRIRHIHWSARRSPAA